MSYENLQLDIENTIQDINHLDYMIVTIYDTGGSLQKSDACVLCDVLARMKERLNSYINKEEEIK